MTKLKQSLCILILVYSLFSMPDYYVLNGLGETLSMGAWLESPENDIITTGSMPNQIVADESGNVWVVASGNATLQRFRPDDGDFILEEEYFLPTGSNPYMMSIHDGKCYVSLWVTGNFAIVDIETGDIEVFEPELLGAQGIFADDDYIYVTASNFDPETFIYGDGQIHRFGHDGNPEGTLTIGTNPQEIVKIDGNLHIACTGNYTDISGSIYIVDTESFDVLDSVIIGGSPSRLSYDPYYGFCYSATSVWGAYGSGRLLAYNASTFEPIWTASDDENTLSGTGLVGLDSYEGYIYISSMDSSTVEIVNHTPETASLEEVAIYPTGYGTQDIAISEISEDIEEEIEHGHAIKANIYPNPFRRECRFHGLEDAQIEIYHVDGRLIEILSNKQVWHPKPSIESGVYLARIKTHGNAFIERLIYLK